MAIIGNIPYFQTNPYSNHIPTRFLENQTQYAQWSTAVMSRIGLLWPGAPRSLGHAQASLRCTQLPMHLAKIVRNENSPAKPCQSKSVVNVATTKQYKTYPQESSLQVNGACVQKRVAADLCIPYSHLS